MHIVTTLAVFSLIASPVLLILIGVVIIVLVCMESRRRMREYGRWKSSHKGSDAGVIPFVRAKLTAGNLIFCASMLVAVINVYLSFIYNNGETHFCFFMLIIIHTFVFTVANYYFYTSTIGSEERFVCYMSICSFVLSYLLFADSSDTDDYNTILFGKIPLTDGHGSSVGIVFDLILLANFAVIAYQLYEIYAGRKRKK